MPDAIDPILATLAALGAEHGGCVSVDALRNSAVSGRRAQSLRDRAALTLVVPKVSIVGPGPITPIALANAAALRGGGSARLDGRTGLEWRGLLDARPTHVTVSVRRSHLAMRQRLQVRLPVSSGGGLAVIEFVPRRRRQPAEHVNGVAVASVPDCLVMLAADESWKDLNAAWREADFRGLLNQRQVEEALGKGITGSRAIRELMARHPIVGEDHKLLSRAERHLVAGLVRRGVAAVINAPVAVGRRTAWPDVYFPEALLAVECDGGGHDSPARQAEDIARAALLATIGIETRRFADVEVWRDVDACIDQIELWIAARRIAAA
ncbi:MAG: DUF559 domain-containing protein [Solirubrobacteraceae bacterium]|nr:DUF559 domain-containing protein [Solirubrobacteraceae bacterium]